MHCKSFPKSSADFCETLKLDREIAGNVRHQFYHGKKHHELSIGGALFSDNDVTINCHTKILVGQLPHHRLPPWIDSWFIDWSNLGDKPAITLGKNLWDLS